MKKLIAAFLLVFSMAGVCFAEQNITVLKFKVKCAEAEGVIPYIDGTAVEDYEKMANKVISDTVKKIVKSVGNRGTFSYAVQLNRSSVVSLLLKAKNGSRECYTGLNLDLTKGNNASIHEFFVADDNVKKILGNYKAYLLTEKGVYLQRDERSNFSSFIPYSQILPSVRIGEAGRLFQIARLSRRCENKVLIIPHHSLMAIQLDANPSTGYHWDAILPESGKIIKVASSFILPQEDKARTGSPGKEIIFLYVDEAGLYDVEFQYKRGWEKFNVDSFKLTVSVRE